MSNNLSLNLIRDQKAHACADSNGCIAETAPSGHALFARQTGQLLVTLGHIFVNVPAFNSHIDQSTGELLISLGQKLARK